MIEPGKTTLFKKSVSLLLSILIWSLSVHAQTILKGIVTDSLSKEPLPFVNILIQQNGIYQCGSQTDFDGIYQINGIDPGEYLISANSIGYKDYSDSIKIIKESGCLTKDIKLQSTATRILSEFDTIVDDTLHIQTFKIADSGFQSIIDCILETINGWKDDYENSIIIIHYFEHLCDSIDKKSMAEFLYCDGTAIELGNTNTEFQPKDDYDYFEITFLRRLNDSFHDATDYAEEYGCIQYRNRIILIPLSITHLWTRPTLENRIAYKKGIGCNLVMLWDPKLFTFVHQSGNWYQFRSSQ